MTARYDIAVIGGGVIGAALSRELLGADLSLVVIDAGAEIPPASGAAAGMLAPSFEEGLGGEALYALSAESLSMWPSYAAALQTETGADIDYRGDGILGVSLGSERTAEMERQCTSLKRRGANISMISGDEARELEPSLSKSVVAGMLAPEDAQVDPVKLLAALRKSIMARRGNVIAQLVIQATCKGGIWRLRLGDGEEITAERIIIATGAARRLQLKVLGEPPIFPVKGEALSLDAATAPFKRVIRGPGAYLCPKSGGRLVVGASEIMHAEDLTVSDEAVISLRESAAQIAPVVSSFEEVTRWAGLRPSTPDGAPILGAAGAHGVYFALGHHRNGVLLAPVSASLLASEILGRGRNSDLSPFRAARFG